ncbi:hypothetical protein Hanom_Chr12g01146341 [Helianthus anomalus]
MKKLGFVQSERMESICRSVRCLIKVVDVIKKILYVAEVDASIVEEGQAMLLQKEKPIVDVEEYKTQKRKSIINLDVDVAASDTDVYMYIYVHRCSFSFLFYLNSVCKELIVFVQMYKFERIQNSVVVM